MHAILYLETLILIGSDLGQKPNELVSQSLSDLPDYNIISQGLFFI